MSATGGMDDQALACASDNSDLIIMGLGTNDDNGGDMTALQAKVESNITALKSSNPNARLAYINVLPRWTDVTGATPVDKSNIRTAIASACTAQSVTCLDPYTEPWILPSDTVEGIHPNASGNTKIWSHISELFI